MRKVNLLIFLLLAALPALAQTALSDLYVIPAAGHTAGAGGTLWMSDLAISNVQPATLNVQLVLIESGENNLDNVFPVVTGPTFTGSVAVPGNGAVLLKDVLKDYRGLANVTGALLVGADMPFTLTSRSYSMTPTGNTIGQTVTPSAGFIDNTIGRTDLATSVAWVPGVISNAQFRTNLGMVAANSSATGATMGVLVTLRDAGGNARGTRLVSVPSGAVIHTQIAAATVADRALDIATAEFRIVSGSGAVVPYASVVDNGTADAVFILGQFPNNATISAAGNAAAPSIFRSIYQHATGAAPESY
jgi:hypothetical protein